MPAYQISHQLLHNMEAGRMSFSYTIACAIGCPLPLYDKLVSRLVVLTKLRKGADRGVDGLDSLLLFT